MRTRKPCTGFARKVVIIGYRGSCSGGSLLQRLLLRRSNMFIAPQFLRYPAPSGAACKRNAPKHMALRWSAKVMVLESYKHSAPLEHFAPKYMPKRVVVQAPCIHKKNGIGQTSSVRVSKSPHRANKTAHGFASKATAHLFTPISGLQ